MTKVTENKETKQWGKQIQKGRYLDIKNIKIKPINKKLLFDQLYNKKIVKDGKIWDLKFSSGIIGLIETPKGWIFTDDEFIHTEPNKEEESIEFDLYGTRKVGTTHHSTMVPLTSQDFTVKQLLQITLPETTIGEWSDRIDYNERIRGNQALLLQTIEKSLIPSNYELNEQLNNISDKEISLFVKKHLIKEGYLPEEKNINELYLQDRPVFKHKRTGEVWEASEVGYKDITLVNLKNPTMIIHVDKEELKNEYIKLGSGIEENTGPDNSGIYGSYKDVEGDMSLMSNDIT